MKEVRTAALVLVAMTLVTGAVYPLTVTGLAQLLFPSSANGSPIERDGRIVGSSLIGQSFSDPKYFWGRLSATGPVPYNAGASSGSNYGPLNDALDQAVRARVEALVAADPEHRKGVPVDLVTSSGSGLDPHVTPAGAQYQVARVAKARGLDPSAVEELVEAHTEGRQLGFLGEPRVNVLELNLALDAIS